MQKTMAPYLPQGLRGHLITALAGAMISLSLAPYKIWPAAIAAIVLYYLCHYQLKPGQAFLRGWFFGAGLFYTGASWVYVSIHQHGGASPLLASFLTFIFCSFLALFYGLSSYIYVRFLRDRPMSWFSLAALIVLNEWLRSWVLTGFPWLFIGYSQTEGPLAGWATVGGVLSISFIVALTGTRLSSYLLNPKPSAWFGIILVIALWFAGPYWSKQEWTQSTEQSLKVSIIQANIPQEEKWLPEKLYPTMNLYQNLSEQEWASDLILWPETAVPSLYHNIQTRLLILDEQAKAKNTAIVTGIPYLRTNTKTQRPELHNSIMAFGEGSGLYHKRRLVPFGEFVPLESMLRGLITFFDLPMSSFSTGPDQQALLKVKDLNIAAFICYEIVYPGLVTEALPQADMLITISNDTWFGESNGPLQHMQMVQMRAIETGRYIIRGTNNGISGIINHKGEVVAEIPQFKQDVLRGTATARTGVTPFAQYGHMPLLCFILLSLSFLLVWPVALKKSHKNKAETKAKETEKPAESRNESQAQ